MIKLLLVVKRKPSMSVREFHIYWREVQGPLVALTPGLRRFFQMYAPEATYAGDGPPYDGVTEAWFENMDVLRRALDTPEWQASVADRPNVFSSTRSLIAQEVTILEPAVPYNERGAAVKQLSFLTNLSYTPLPQFQSHWRDAHAPILLREHPDVRGYVQSHTLLETYEPTNPPAFDGVSEIWLPNLEAGLRWRRSSAEIADEGNFLDSPGVTMLVQAQAIGRRLPDSVHP